MTGEVRDKVADNLIGDAKVVFLDGDNNVLEETKSDANGVFEFSEVECSKAYAIRASKEGFSVSEKSFTSGTDFEAKIKKTLYLETEKEVEVVMEVGQDLGTILNLNPIYFDLSQSYIRPDAQLELQKIINVMHEYPTMKIDVRSHTDSRSSDRFNLKLSEARAQSTIKYIVGQGIDRSRLNGRGYGESQLLNNCGNGSGCTEAEHQLNRRSEFIIIAR